MPSYDWRCHACNVQNRREADSCHTCGCPAVASGPEIDAAISGRTTKPSPSRGEAEKILRDRIVALPLWKKAVAYVLRGVAAAGRIIFGAGLFSLAADGMMSGLVIVVVASLLLTGLFGAGSRDNEC